MFTKIKQVAVVGAAVVGVCGWMTVVSPAVGHTQPPRIPQDVGISCPNIAGIDYVRDPDDSNAYYLCVDGMPQRRLQCPAADTQLIMSMPPKCAPLLHHH